VSIGRRTNRGQAAVELVAVLPVVAALAAVLWQLAVAGHAVWAAAAAARVAARAAAVGADPAAAARGALPDRLEQGLRVSAGHDGEVAVRVGVPLVTGGGRLLTIVDRARFAPQTP
jgi:hypothetical protein